MKKKAFEPELESINKIQTFVRANLAESGCAPEKLFKIDLIIEELIVNIIKHGFKTVEKGAITVAMETADKTAVLKIRDNGIPFNPLQAEAPDVHLPLEKRAPGGLGIYMVKQMAKEIHYSHEAGENRTRLLLPL